MTEEDLIEVGARAIHREFCRVTLPRYIKAYESYETEEESWDRRWGETEEIVRERYRAEARAILLAVGVLR